MTTSAGQPFGWYSRRPIFETSADCLAYHSNLTQVVKTDSEFCWVFLTIGCMTTSAEQPSGQYSSRPIFERSADCLAYHPNLTQVVKTDSEFCCVFLTSTGTQLPQTQHQQNYKLTPSQNAKNASHYRLVQLPCFNTCIFAKFTSSPSLSTQFYQDGTSTWLPGWYIYLTGWYIYLTTRMVHLPDYQDGTSTWLPGWYIYLTTRMVHLPDYQDGTSTWQDGTSTWLPGWYIYLTTRMVHLPNRMVHLHDYQDGTSTWLPGWYIYLTTRMVHLPDYQDGTSTWLPGLWWGCDKPDRPAVDNVCLQMSYCNRPTFRSMPHWTERVSHLDASNSLLGLHHAHGLGWLAFWHQLCRSQVTGAEQDPFNQHFRSVRVIDGHWNDQTQCCHLQSIWNIISRAPL